MMSIFCTLKVFFSLKRRVIFQTCKDCKGRGWERCDECDGWGRVECDSCGGSGRTHDIDMEGNYVDRDCPFCMGGMRRYAFSAVFLQSRCRFDMLFG